LFVDRMMMLLNWQQMTSKWWQNYRSTHLWYVQWKYIANIMIHFWVCMRKQNSKRSMMGQQQREGMWQDKSNGVSTILSPTDWVLFADGYMAAAGEWMNKTNPLDCSGGRLGAAWLGDEMCCPEKSLQGERRSSSIISAGVDRNQYKHRKKFSTMKCE
jgi:hypothetical protein